MTRLRPGRSVAVVGRPNVGKSTLVNRLSGRRSSIVHPTPGLTRDRLEVPVDWNGQTFHLFDTGGISRSQGPGLLARTEEQAMRAIEESDLILMVVDSTTGPTDEDQALARRLLRSPVPSILVANKVEDEAGEAAAAAFWSLGLGEPFPLSALHGRGSGDLLDLVLELLPPESGPPAADLATIAIVGRPNVGKSSLFNALAGEQRAIVQPEPGTTLDSIDAILEVGGHPYRFIDTAGMRRHARTQGVEVFSASRTRQAISRADLAILMLDAAEGPTSQDLRVAREVSESGAGAILAVNKWDLLPPDDPRPRAGITEALEMLSYAPAIRMSVTTGRGIAKLPPLIETVLEQRGLRIPTGPLNQLFQGIQDANPPPRAGDRRVRILYATQASTAPPTFVLFTTGKLPDGWLRYAERKLRESFGFTGNPMRFNVRERS